MNPKNKSQSNPWTLIQPDEKFDCHYYVARSDMVKHDVGVPRRYNHVKMKHFALAVLPIDNEGYTTLVGQYRYPLDRYTWEVPRGGGRLDKEPLHAAIAELSEETGFKADYWLELFSGFASPGTTDEIAPCFVAWGLHEGEPHPDPEEQITLRRVRFVEAVSLVLSGEVSDLASIAVILGLKTRFELGALPSDLFNLVKLGVVV